ncbi:MAG: hypothetical protein QRY74_05375 [Chlamydia sp.]
MHKYSVSAICFDQILQKTAVIPAVESLPVQIKHRLSKSATLFLSLFSPLEVTRSFKRPIKAIASSFCKDNRTRKEWRSRLFCGSIAAIKIPFIKIGLLFAQLFTPNRCQSLRKSLLSAYCTYKVMILSTRRWADGVGDWRDKIIALSIEEGLKNQSRSLSKTCKQMRVQDLALKSSIKEEILDGSLENISSFFIKEISENGGKKLFWNKFETLHKLMKCCKATRMLGSLKIDQEFSYDWPLSIALSQALSIERVENRITAQVEEYKNRLAHSTIGAIDAQIDLYEDFISSLEAQIQGLSALEAAMPEALAALKIRNMELSKQFYVSSLLNIKPSPQLTNIQKSMEEYCKELKTN